MKSKYGYWKRWLNSLAGLVCLMGLAGCKNLTCDFSYSPTTPVAGGVVTFTNSSTGADDYSWTFGDNTTSTTSSPTHIYRKPGDYTVTLLIKRNKVEKRTRTQHIRVEDTIPSLACDSDSIYTFTPVKFYPRVYNPWKKTLTYHWEVPSEAVLMAGKSLDSSAIVCYFTQPGKASQVELTIQMNDEVPDTLKYTFTPTRKYSSSVVYATAQDTIEQFAYAISNQHVFQSASPCDANGKALLKAEQSTSYWYGTHQYTIHTVDSLLGEHVKGFQVDFMMKFIYAYGDGGLWVCNMQGKNKRHLITTAVKAIKVDGGSNCLYWATNQGIMVSRLLLTKDHNLSPEIVSTDYSTINKISVNSNLH